MTITAGWYHNSKASLVRSAALLTTIRELTSVELNMNRQSERGGLLNKKNQFTVIV